MITIMMMMIIIMIVIVVNVEYVKDNEQRGGKEWTPTKQTKAFCE